MLGLAPDYDHLTVIQKVEVFEHALESTSGEDLHRVMWLKSRSSEVGQRQKFTLQPEGVYVFWSIQKVRFVSCVGALWGDTVLVRPLMAERNPSVEDLLHGAAAI